MYVSAGLGEGTEGLSLAILETMAAGLPVVAKTFQAIMTLL